MLAVFFGKFLFGFSEQVLSAPKARTAVCMSIGHAVDCYLKRYLRQPPDRLIFCYVVDFIGGRTRARTWDPLIKSHMFTAVFQKVSWKTYENRSITRQWVKSKKENDSPGVS